MPTARRNLPGAARPAWYNDGAMGDWWERELGWLRRHAALAPFGILAVTALLVYFAGPGRWQGADDFKLAAEQIDLAAALYAAFAVTVERGVRMIWWAIEQRRKDREKLVNQGRAAGRAEAFAEARAEERARVRKELERVVRERTTPITLAELQELLLKETEPE